MFNRAAFLRKKIFLALILAALPAAQAWSEDIGNDLLKATFGGSLLSSKVNAGFWVGRAIYDTPVTGYGFIENGGWDFGAETTLIDLQMGAKSDKLHLEWGFGMERLGRVGTGVIGSGPVSSVWSITATDLYMGPKITYDDHFSCYVNVSAYNLSDLLEGDWIRPAVGKDVSVGGSTFGIDFGIDLSTEKFWDKVQFSASAGYRFAKFEHINYGDTSGIAGFLPPPVLDYSGLAFTIGASVDLDDSSKKKDPKKDAREKLLTSQVPFDMEPFSKAFRSGDTYLLGLFITAGFEPSFDKLLPIPKEPAKALYQKSFDFLYDLGEKAENRALQKALKVLVMERSAKGDNKKDESGS